jgi:hypothetical protein
MYIYICIYNLLINIYTNMTEYYRLIGILTKHFVG